MNHSPQSQTHAILDTSDSAAFAAEIEPLRRAIWAHCYRMLGNLHEAEDLAQEALTRAWLKRATFEGRGSLRAWIYKIATNACLNTLQRRPRRTLPVARGQAATIDAPIPPAIQEPVWLEPFPDDLWQDSALDPEANALHHESISLAFMTVLQLLPPRQRAILLFSDVLDWPAKDIASALETTAPAVKSALHRARQTLATANSKPHMQALPHDDAIRQLLDRYVNAWQSANIEALVSLLIDEATFSMPPIPAWYRGRASIRWLIARTVFAGAPQRRWRLIPTRANGHHAFGLYKLDEASGRFQAYGIQVLTFFGSRVADITTCINPTLVTRFGLPADVA